MEHVYDQHGIRFHTRDELERLSFERLMRHRKALRAVIGMLERNLGDRCCELCNEYIGDDWEGDVEVHVRPYKDHLDEVKDVLRGFPHRAKPKMRRCRAHTYGHAAERFRQVGTLRGRDRRRG